MFNRILVIGATGMLGRPVVSHLTEGSHKVRILTRSVERAPKVFGGTVEIAEGSATNMDDVRLAMAGCNAVHINLSPATEYTATSHVIELAQGQLERIGYVSATTKRIDGSTEST
ncbi:MAG: NAD(P)H-binding protein [Gemmatimonadales bacterium]